MHHLDFRWKQAQLSWDLLKKLSLKSVIIEALSNIRSERLLTVLTLPIVSYHFDPGLDLYNVN